MSELTTANQSTPKVGDKVTIADIPFKGSIGEILMRNKTIGTVVKVNNYMFFVEFNTLPEELSVLSVKTFSFYAKNLKIISSSYKII